MRRVGALFLVLCPFLSCSLSRALPKQKQQEKPRPLVKNLNRDSGPTKKKAFFRESSKKYGLQNKRGIRFYAVDFDQDSWTDLVILPDYFSVPEFYRFSPLQKKFIPLGHNPFRKNIQGSFLNFVDLDKNGLLDVIVATLAQKSELTQISLRTFQGVFVKGKIFYKEILSGIRGSDQKRLWDFPLASLSALDFDLDGKLDLFLGAWFKRDSLQKQVLNTPDMLFKGDFFKFENQSSLLLMEWDKKRNAVIYTNARPTFASSTCDVDQNGYPDILTASSSRYPNKLWLNKVDLRRGGPVFRNFGTETGYAQDNEGKFELRGGGYTFFSACADYNNDSIMDIFIGELSHFHDSEKVDISSILTGKARSFPPQFIRTSYTHDEKKSWSQGDRRGIWWDYNNDGLLDLLVDNSGFPPHSRMVLFEQGRDHAYQERGNELGVDIVNPVGSIILDVNRDGRMDILTGQSGIRDVNIQPRLYLFENTLPRKGRRSLRFFLRGISSNIQALGAMVILKTSRGIKRQWVEYQQGAQGSQNEEGVSFGLERGEKPLSVTVRWPYREEKGIKKTHYPLSQYQFRHFLFLGLCENGRAKVGWKGDCL